MKHVFVLQNQDKQLLTKSGEWSDGRDANSLYRTEHKDEAINQQFEVSSKDYTLRISLLKCALNERRNPVIPEDQLPEPMAMPEVDDTESASAEAAENAEVTQETVVEMAQADQPVIDIAVLADIAAELESDADEVPDSDEVADSEVAEEALDPQADLLVSLQSSEPGKQN